MGFNSAFIGLNSTKYEINTSIWYTTTQPIPVVVVFKKHKKAQGRNNELTFG
jgi:hypothetical protein